MKSKFSNNISNNDTFVIDSILSKTSLPILKLLPRSRYRAISTRTIADNLNIPHVTMYRHLQSLQVWDNVKFITKKIGFHKELFYYLEYDFSIYFKHSRIRIVLDK